jgi:hypothetical protein
VAALGYIPSLIPTRVDAVSPSDWVADRWPASSAAAVLPFAVVPRGRRSAAFGRRRASCHESHPEVRRRGALPRHAQRVLWGLSFHTNAVYKKYTHFGSAILMFVWIFPVF